MIVDKKKLREVMRQKRTKISQVDRVRADKKIAKRLRDSALFKRAKTVGFYISNENEVATDFLLNFVGKKTLIVPRTKRKHVHLYKLEKSTNFEKGKFGIREPMRAPLFKNWSKIDLFIVPGLAFDLRGHRVGYGGGFFDRLLSKLNCTTIALAYKLQIVDKIPERKYDVAVSYILTEDRFIPCKLFPTSKNKIHAFTKSYRAKLKGSQKG